jgi:hypothetical protein
VCQNNAESPKWESNDEWSEWRSWEAFTSPLFVNYLIFSAIILTNGLHPFLSLTLTLWKDPADRNTKGINRRAVTVPKMSYVIRNAYCTVYTTNTVKEKTSQ